MEQPAIINFQTQLANFLKARFPFLYISTWEEDRVLSVIKENNGVSP